ncbi:MAG: hypothetical protein ABIU96_14845 [Rhodanobacter sp.]
MWIALTLCAFVIGGCQHIHDPWVKPGAMQAERNVGVQQQVQLHTRQLRGQSDR